MRGVEEGGEASTRDKKFKLPPLYQAFFSVGDVKAKPSCSGLIPA